MKIHCSSWIFFDQLITLSTDKDGTSYIDHMKLFLFLFQAPTCKLHEINALSSFFKHQVDFELHVHVQQIPSFHMYRNHLPSSLFPSFLLQTPTCKLHESASLSPSLNTLGTSDLALWQAALFSTCMASSGVGAWHPWSASQLCNRRRLVAASPALAAALFFCHSLNTTSTPTRPRNNVNSTTRENILRGEGGGGGRREEGGRREGGGGGGRREKGGRRGKQLIVKWSSDLEGIKLVRDVNLYIASKTYVVSVLLCSGNMTEPLVQFS